MFDLRIWVNYTKFVLKLDRGKLLIIVSIALGLLIIFFLAYRYIAPFGKIVSFRFTSKLPGAQQATVFAPETSKGSILQIPTQIVTTSKTKLQLKLPQGKIETIKTTLKFKPNINEVIIGIRGNEKNDFLYQPLYRDTFRDLNWNKVEADGLSLWQKEKKFNSLKDFIVNPPLDKTIASYYLSPDKLQAIKTDTNKKDKNTKTVTETSLRGNLSVFIRVDQSPLILKVVKQDMNSYDGEDKLKIKVSKGGKNLAERIIADDGLVDANLLKLKSQEEIITLDDIDPGIYQLDLIDESKSADMLITRIEVNQSKVIFKDNIFPLGNTPTALWTNIDNLKVITVHDVGLQTIKLDDQYDLKIDQRDKKYSFDLRELTGNKATNKIYKLVSPKNDLIIDGNGYFAFSEEAFFLPEIIKTEKLNDLDSLDGVDYLLTGYKLPKTEGEWFTAEAYFDLKDINVDGDTLYFSLEVPQIAKYGGEVEIDYLDINVGTKEALVKTEKITDSQVEKQNILQKSKTWVATKFSQLKNWLSNSWQNLFKKTPATIVITKPSPTLMPSPTTPPAPSTSPSPSPQEKISLLVRILNGGAGKGAAGVLAKALDSAGFTNVVADTADKTDYKNATIIYRKEDLAIMAKLNDLLRKDYKEVTRTEVATTSAEIVVIIGEK